MTKWALVYFEKKLREPITIDYGENVIAQDITSCVPLILFFEARLCS